jgi:hypothetical protein
LIAADGTGIGFSTNYEPMKDSGVTVRGVVPGKYLVRVQAMLGSQTMLPGRTIVGGYVQSVRSGSLDLLQEPLAVAESGSVPPIEVVVRDDPAALKVTVRAEKPGQPATILVYPEGALFLSPTHRMTVTSETYFGPLAPGSYKVFAFDSIEGIDYVRPEAMAKYAAQATRVTITANRESSVAVDVIHTGD